MPAISDRSRTDAPTRGRLPLTPRVTLARRGGHAPIRSETSPKPAAVAPAFHITPDVVVAPRGDLALSSVGHSFVEAIDGGALQVGRFRN